MRTDPAFMLGSMLIARSGGTLSRAGNGTAMHEPIFNLEDFDAQTWRLELAARLQGASGDEMRELTRDRERERARLVDQMEGFCVE